MNYNISDNNKYLILLASEYIKALDVKAIDLESNGFKKDLNDWIYERQLIGEEYVRFLKYLGKDITTFTTAEVGKGNFDSIVKNYDTTVITPYDYIAESNRVLNYEFFPNRDNPGLMKFDNVGNLIEVISSPSYISEYITQNPYDRADLIGYEDLHNGNNFDIIVGVYGHVHDHDTDSKLKMLKELREKLVDYDTSNRLEYATNIYKNYYYATLFTDNKVKRLNKVK